LKLTLETLRYYAHDCGDCLLWKQGTNGAGYPQATIDGKGGQMVRRYIFTHLMGKELRTRQVVTSRCDTKLCISPDHLISSWMGKIQERSYRTGKRMSRVEYTGRLERSIRSGWSKLGWEDIAKIRAEPESVSHAEIGRLYGIHHKTASKIRRGLSWRVSAMNSSVFNWRPEEPKAA
jgi:hypothetical protein